MFLYSEMLTIKSKILCSSLSIFPFSPNTTHPIIILTLINLHALFKIQCTLFTSGFPLIISYLTYYQMIHSVRLIVNAERNLPYLSLLLEIISSILLPANYTAHFQPKKKPQ